MRTGETVLTGNPHIDYGDLRLTADEIRVNPQTHVATARGHAILTQGPRRLLADEITYHSDTGVYEVGEVRLGEFPVYVSGSSATGDAKGVTIRDAHVTATEPGELVPTLRAAQLFFSADRTVHIESASIGIGRVRPIPVHGFDQNIRHPVLPYATLTGGYRHSLGVFVLAGLHIPLNEFFRLGGDLGLYSSRGIMAGPSGAYSGTVGDDTFTGAFRSGFIHDYGTRSTDILGRPVPPRRGFVEWQHQQQLGEHLAITGQLNYWRDSEVLRDFRPSEFFRVQQPDSFIESVYAGDNYLVSLFARFQPNSYQVVQQRLPELRFDLLPLAVGNGFVERFQASFASLRDDPPSPAPLNPTPGPDLHSDRLDAYYSLSRPIAPTAWFAFTPVVGGRLTHYSNTSGNRGDYTRALGEIGFDTELRTSGTWDYKNKQWKIDGLRHLLTPKLSYRYIPEADKGAAYIPPIDRLSFSTYLQPLGLGDIRNLDTLHATNTLRLGFDNTLQTRDATYGSRDLLRFNVANDFLFDRAPGERDVSRIHTDLAIMPARWLELGVYQSFTPQDFTLQEFNTGVTLRDGAEWTVRFASNFLRDHNDDAHPGLNDYYIQASKRLNEVYEAVGRIRYDARTRRFIEQAYGIRQNVGNTWSVEYIVTLYNGPRRESNFGLSVRIDAIRF